jgi:hypothetical protein
MPPVGWLLRARLSFDMTFHETGLSGVFEVHFEPMSDDRDSCPLLVPEGIRKSRAES